MIHKTLENIAGVVLLVVLMLFIAGCSQGSPTQTQTHPVQPTAVATTNNGQIIVTVGYKELGGWIEANKDITIVSITSIATTIGTSNSTSGFVIVYTAPAERSKK